MRARAEAVEVCKVEGEGRVSEFTVIEWFKRFNNGETSLEDQLVVF